MSEAMNLEELERKLNSPEGFVADPKVLQMELSPDVKVFTYIADLLVFERAWAQQQQGGLPPIIRYYHQCPRCNGTGKLKVTKRGEEPAPR